ncbi:unnamed protein product, partial [Mesorhabditis belari]|uniref:K Homology domain-containing protein n=1 Tax=Mesorhabditis belari TaxID=2138241 RepID=A0AAF3FAN1_9BILA
MKEELGPLSLTTLNLPTQLPGSWFYEIGGSGDDSSTSPSQIGDEEVNLALGGLKSLLSTRTVTETVQVPSSEHVAEIVGRQGCKIKALRAKTNTYIKTPVTGRSEDVMEAKREIECAAEHFTQIRASRRHSQGGAPAPGHITAYVRVPLRVVGLVVGPKGATIKRIQQDTHTYIITPSREREPIFEVTGLPQNVESARKEIEQHIYQRTGNMPITDPNAPISSYQEFQNVPPQNQMINGGFSSLSAAASVAARSTYGSLAATSTLRRQEMTGLEMGRPTDNYGNMNQPLSIGMENGSGKMHLQFNTSGQNTGNGNNQNALAAAATANGVQPYLQWSNAYTGMNLGNEPLEINNHFPNPQPYPKMSDLHSAMGNLSLCTVNHPYHQNQNQNVSRQRMWSSPFVATNDPMNSFSNQRDEGLGDSPPSLATDSYHLMSSIWSEIDNPRDRSASGSATNAHFVSGLTVSVLGDSSTTYSSGISQ